MESRTEKRIRRHERLRAVVRGTALRPRAAIFRSHQHIYVQLIDDETGRTVESANDAMLSDVEIKGKKKSETALRVWSLAESAFAFARWLLLGIGREKWDLALQREGTLPRRCKRGRIRQRGILLRCLSQTAL